MSGAFPDISRFRAKIPGSTARKIRHKRLVRLMILTARSVKFDNYPAIFPVRGNFRLTGAR
jgi:hypothetical protein